MAAYPIIIPNASPVVVTTASSSLSYEMLINSLNYIAYKIKRLYMEGTTLSQVSTNFLYNTVRPDGQQYSLNTNGNADPYQFLNVLDLSFENGDGLILDNMSVLSFNIEPLATLEMYFYTDTVSYAYNLDDNAPVIEYEDGDLPVKQENKNSELNFDKVALGIVLSSLALLTLITLFNKKRNE